MDYEKLIEDARSFARDAGALLREYVGKRLVVELKGRIDVVTEADRKSQDLVRKAIREHYPDHGILAEEGLDEGAGAAYRWIVDPLDGTTNFSHGMPVFCVSIAVEHEGEVKAGVVYGPMLDEMFWAVKGGGAFLDGERIRVSEINSLDRALLATGFPYDVRENPDNNLDHFSRFAKRAQAIRRCGAAALDMCYTACGRFDGFWELRLFPWDMAAGMLIIAEAGGLVSDFGGRPIDIHAKEILASNGRIHGEMVKVLGGADR